MIKFWVLVLTTDVVSQTLCIGLNVIKKILMGDVIWEVYKESCKQLFGGLKQITYKIVVRRKVNFI